MMQQMFLGFGGASEEEYFIDSNTTMSIDVPKSCTNIIIAGAGKGASGVFYSLGGYGGGGGGSNTAGHTIPAAPLNGSVIFVSTSNNATVYAGPSASSPVIFQANQGSGQSGGSVPVGGGSAGGSGGNAGGRFISGSAGASGGTGGGGGGGGAGDNEPQQIPGGAGGGGGTSSLIGTTITPLGVGPASPWTITTGTTGGRGGNGPGGDPGGGGTGGGGFIINGTGYGGGGGGGGASRGGSGGAGGAGAGAFLIIQFIN